MVSRSRPLPRSGQVAGEHGEKVLLRDDDACGVRFDLAAQRGGLGFGGSGSEAGGDDVEGFNRGVLAQEWQ
jgi:hypothetical protein